MNTEKSTNKKVNQWRFFIPLLLQTAFIIAIPAHSFYTYSTGKTVILQTQPIDPYELLRGYSQTLSYNISQTSDLSKLNGWQELYNQLNGYNDYYFTENRTIYVTLKSPNNNQKPPLPWQPIAVSLTYPQDLKPDQIVLKGIIQYSRVTYGLETYYFPESKREEINQKINTIQAQDRQKFVVEIKVDPQGNAVPVSLWVGEENYRF